MFSLNGSWDGGNIWLKFWNDLAFSFLRINLKLLLSPNHLIDERDILQCKLMVNQWNIYSHYGMSLKHIPSLQLLMILIDKHLNWFSQINYLHLKLLKYFQISYILFSKYWGIKSWMLKTWYLTIIEKLLLMLLGLKEETCIVSYNHGAFHLILVFNPGLNLLYIYE